MPVPHTSVIEPAHATTIIEPVHVTSVVDLPVSLRVIEPIHETGVIEPAHTTGVIELALTAYNEGDRMAFNIKQHDTRPAYIADLVDDATGTPVPINLTTATSVTFKMRTAGAADATAPVVSAVATIVTPATGRVRHTWLAAHTGTAGAFEAEFEITWNDGGIETVPNDGYVTINVIEDLDAG